MSYAGCHNDGGCGGNPERPQINDIFSCCEATGGTGTFRDENGECFILPGMWQITVSLVEQT